MEKIKESGSITDKTLARSLAKDGYNMSDDLFNKTLLDMEIMGLVTVNWFSKDTRRIEIISIQAEDDEVAGIEIANEGLGILEKINQAQIVSSVLWARCCANTLSTKITPVAIDTVSKATPNAMISNKICSVVCIGGRKASSPCSFPRRNWRHRTP